MPTLDWLIVSLNGTIHGPTYLVRSVQAGLKKLQKYEEIIYEGKIPFIATFLNPTLKLTNFKEHCDPSSQIHGLRFSFSDNYANDESQPKDGEIDESENNDGQKCTDFTPKFKNI